MATLNDRKPTVRDLAAAPEARPSPQRIPARGFHAVATTPPSTSPLDPAGVAAPGGRCRCNPEVTVGILTAFMAPAAARLRVAQPVRAGASSILDATPHSLCGPRPPFRVAEFMLACNLCYRQIGSGHLFMYKGEMAFCSPECRHHYSLQDLHRERQRRARASMPVRRGVARADGGEESIFFVCADNL